MAELKILQGNPAVPTTGRKLRVALRLSHEHVELINRYRGKLKGGAATQDAVVAHALELLDFLAQEEARGNKILLAEPDGMRLVTPIPTKEEGK